MGLIHQSAVIEHHPLNRTLPTFRMAKPQPIRGFPALSLGHSDVDNECDITLHIKASVYVHSWHFILGLGSEHLLGPSFWDIHS